MKRFLSLAFLGIVAALMLGIIPQIQAQSGYTWTADFYNNESLSGSAVRQTYTNMNFNWGFNSPASGIAADHWSARFTTIANFNAGTYRFTVNADDAVRVYVHGQLYIDTWNAPRIGQNVSADVTLAAGAAGITVDFRDNTNEAYLNFSWSQVTGGNPVPTGTWVAEYWNNRSLSNNPNVVINEASPNHDWGTGAPVNGVGADNFSARWSSQQNFNAGNYRITVTADDGVRVYVNGSRIIDEWHGAPTIATYARDVTLFTGLNTFVIEYYEEVGIARLNFSIAPVSVQPTQAPLAGIPQLTINTPLLNVRSAPFIGDNIINKVPRGATYIVVGRNADSSWWQIQIGEQIGWVSGAYVITANTQNVPVITTNVQVPNAPSVGTGYFLRSTANLNIRTGAGTSFSRINILPYNREAEILGRNSSNTWWLITYGGTTGWVSGAFVTLPVGIDLNRIPIR